MKSDKDKLGEAYDSQEHAPKKGVKGDDLSEYSAKGTSDWDKSVQPHGAFREMSHAPMGKGSSGPTDSMGKKIDGWDAPVSKGMAYASQHKADKSGEQASLGFKTSEGHKYMGHFAEDKFLRMGHNDGDSSNMNLSNAVKEAAVDEENARKKISASFNQNVGMSGVKESLKNMKKYINGDDE